MNKYAYVIQLPGVVDDPNCELETLGAFECKVYKQGNGSGLAKILFGTTASIKVETIGAELFSDPAGLISLGSSYETTIGVQTLYLRATQEKGKLIFNDAEFIDRLTNNAGGSFFEHLTELSDSPYIEYDLSSLPINIVRFFESGNNKVTGDINSLRGYSSLIEVYFRSRFGYSKNTCGGELMDGTPLIYDNFNWNGSPKHAAVISLRTVKSRQFSLGGGYQNTLALVGELSDLDTNIVNYNIGIIDDRVTGDLSSLSALPLTDINMAANNTVVGDIKHIPITTKYINIPINDKVTYSGGKLWGNGMRHLALSSAKFSLATVETILKELSYTVWNASTPNKLISLGCTETVNLSAEAQSAVASLNGQGITVSILKI